MTGPTATDEASAQSPRAGPIRPARRATVARVEYVRLPDPRLTVDGGRVGCATRIAYAGAYQLTVWTTVPELAAELHSSYLGHPAATRRSATWSCGRTSRR